MSEKQQIISALQEQLQSWKTFLSTLSEEELTRPQPSSSLSIKDELAHLMAWQKISIARMEAALQEREPHYPEWPTGLNLGLEGDADDTNRWIFEKYRHQSWPAVHQQWREGFQRLIALGEAAADDALGDRERYEWLKGHPLSLILTASREHHQEHLDDLRARRAQPDGT